MAVHLKVALAAHLQVEQAVAPERGEHMVEKPDARLHVRFARAVKTDGQVDVGFLRGAHDMRNAFAHCRSPFFRRVRIDSGQITSPRCPDPRRPSAPASARLKFWAVLQARKPVLPGCCKTDLGFYRALPESRCVNRPDDGDRRANRPPFPAKPSRRRGVRSAEHCTARSAAAPGPYFDRISRSAARNSSFSWGLPMETRRQSCSMGARLKSRTRMPRS